MQMFPASPGHSCGHVDPHFAVIDHFSTDEAARGSLGDFLPRTEPKSTRTQQKSPRSRQKVSAAQSVAWKSRSGLLLTSEPCVAPLCPTLVSSAPLSSSFLLLSPRRLLYRRPIPAAPPGGTSSPSAALRAGEPQIPEGNPTAAALKSGARTRTERSAAARITAPPRLTRKRKRRDPPSLLEGQVPLSPGRKRKPGSLSVCRPDKRPCGRSVKDFV